MDRWPRRAKNKPKGWVVESVPMDLFREWMETPGLEDELKASMRSGGLPEGSRIIIVSGEEYDGYSDIWLHPVAAHKFGSWYASKLSIRTGAPRFGVLYAAIYDNGLTKVGMSINSGADRIADHDATMDLTGASPVEHIVVECKTNPRGAEDKLVDEMAKRYQQKRREWFVGSDPAVVRELIGECIEKDWQERCQSANVCA